MLKVYRLYSGQWAYEITTGPFTGKKVFPFPTKRAAIAHAKQNK
jgi:hypothetical protein